MPFFKSKLKSFTILLASLIGMYTLLRIVFIAGNYAEFQILDTKSLFSIFWHGLRFDLSAIFMTNSIYFLLYSFPFRLATNKVYKRILKILFFGVNIFFLIVNCIDVVYFPFVQKRMQLDTFRFLSGDKGTEVYGLIPTFLLEFWYMWVLFGIIIFGLNYTYKKALSSNNYLPNSVKAGLQYIGFLILLVALTVIGSRGGLQLRPLSVINASESVDVLNAPAVLNSTFSLIKTSSKKPLNEVNYIPEHLFSDCDKGVHIGVENSDSIQKLNIVIILVESLSKQYLSYYNGTGETPFLDSLIGESYIFSNGFANARESIQGIPAVLSSIPSLQDEPFIFSQYSSNSITSIASILKPEGYSSSFFHGAALGTMGFYPFVKLAGFDHYYSKDDFIGPDSYDGSWGIWDEQFLKFMAQTLEKTSKPFVASVLTLNPHHPFKIPQRFQKPFNKKGNPIFNSLRYEDYCLQQFFEEAKKQSWYQNTIFVITADHTGPNTDVMKTQMDEYRIPILFFKPNGSLKGSSETLANQMDIMPTLLAQLGYHKTYYSPGKDLFSSDCPHAATFYRMGIFHYVNDVYYYQFNGEKGVGFYLWKNDKYLRNNLINTGTYDKQIHQCDVALKKVIQNYNYNMIHNKMKVDSKKMKTNE